MADRITAFAGSMNFVWIHAALFGVWMLLVERNPSPTLTLVVPLEAISLSTFVMIGQNRQAAFQQSRADLTSRPRNCSSRPTRSSLTRSTCLQTNCTNVSSDPRRDVATVVGDLSEVQRSIASRVRALMRAAVRSSACRPNASEQAAGDFQKNLWAAVGAEIRWAFTSPRTWLAGVAVNMLFAAAWLLVQPLATDRHHHDWVILIGTYFSSWILADVTTTNMLGADHYRVDKALSDGVPFWRIQLIKNLALLAIVGLPTLATAVALTLWLETPARLGLTVPTVAVPIVSWLGVGNVISAVYPVRVKPLIRRWRQRHDRRRTGNWLLSLTLPYAVYYVADPMDGVEHHVLWTVVPEMFWPVFGRDSKSLVHLGIALGVWLTGSVVGALWVRKRGIHCR